jgi:endonuclease YncB( thermonuclease family)
MWFFAGLIVGLAAAGAPEIEANGAVVLDGVKVAVHWDDGDTFTVVGKGTKARLDGFNTLESYGAVHRFGPGEDALYDLVKKAGKVAMESVWNCTT